MAERREAERPARKRTPARPQESGVHQRFDDAAPDPDATLSELTGMLVSSLDYRGNLRELSRVLAARVASTCMLELRRPVAMRFADGPPLDEAMASVARDAAERAIATAVPVVSAADGARTALAAPLRARDDTPLGALALVGAPGRPIALSPEDAAELGRRIASAVHNGHLYEAALAAARMRDEMLSTVSHDLKNPLGIILLSAARLLGAGGPESDRHGIEVIHRSAKRMRGLVADLLDMEALDASAIAIHPCRCDPAELVDDAIDSFAPMAADAGVTLRRDVGDATPPIWADPDRVAQILGNLVSNAIKFTPHGGAVTVSAHAESNHVGFAVADTGIGIAPEHVPHVFDRFWQAPAARKLGSGLGLSICKSLVELSAGTIRAESVLGRGTVIAFTMPLVARGSGTIPCR